MSKATDPTPTTIIIESASSRAFRRSGAEVARAGKSPNCCPFSEWAPTLREIWIKGYQMEAVTND